MLGRRGFLGRAAALIAAAATTRPERLSADEPTPAPPLLPEPGVGEAHVL